MVDFMKKFCLAAALCFFSPIAFATPPVYGPLQAQNNLDDVDSASTSLANLGGLSSATAAATYAPLASPTFTGTVTIPTITVSGGTINNTSVGGTTASTGAFTTLSASSTVSGTGFSTFLASPPAIGGTTAASGKFTTLTATSTVSGIGLIGIQTFCSSGCSSTGGTYTADAGTQSVIVEVQAPGGGSGGTTATAASQSSVGGAGAAGSYARVYITSGFSGATVTVPIGGTAGTTAGNGGSGSTASFGTFASCPGGGGGSAGGAGTSASFGGATASPATCTISGATQLLNIAGGAGGSWQILTPGTASISSGGGISELGSGGQPRSGLAAGAVGNGYGAGAGAGNTPTASSAAQTGAAGAQSIVIVYEYN